MRNLINKLMKDESGQDMAEYAIALGIIALGTIAAFTTLGGDIAGALGVASAKLQAIK